MLENFLVELHCVLKPHRPHKIALLWKRNLSIPFRSSEITLFVDRKWVFRLAWTLLHFASKNKQKPTRKLSVENSYLKSIAEPFSNAFQQPVYGDNIVLNKAEKFMKDFLLLPKKNNLHEARADQCDHK